MNKNRRELLKKASGLLNTASGLVSSALDGEEDALDNVPENLQSSEQYEKRENIVDCLNDASDSIDTAIERIKEAIA